jgi:hypothetical protein
MQLDAVVTLELMIHPVADFGVLSWGGRVVEEESNFCAYLVEEGLLLWGDRRVAIMIEVGGKLSKVL